MNLLLCVHPDDTSMPLHLIGWLIDKKGVINENISEDHAWNYSIPAFWDAGMC